MGVHFPARVDEAVVVGPAIPDEVPIIVQWVVDIAECLDFPVCAPRSLAGTCRPGSGRCCHRSGLSSQY